jgi:hypothetical protein
VMGIKHFSVKYEFWLVNEAKPLRILQITQ